MSNDFYHTIILPHAGIITKICRAYTNSQEDFEDYYQEVCLQIWKSRHNFKGNSEWSTWIYRVTLNVCLTLVKKTGVPTEKLKAQHKLLPSQEGDSVEKDQAINELYRAIKALSDIDRAIILLYLEEQSYREIAQIMGMNTTNIGVRINRIKKRLKTILNGRVN